MSDNISTKPKAHERRKKRRNATSSCTAQHADEPYYGSSMCVDVSVRRSRSPCFAVSGVWRRGAGKTTRLYQPSIVTESSTTSHTRACCFACRPCVFLRCTFVLQPSRQHSYVMPHLDARHEDRTMGVNVLAPAYQASTFRCVACLSKAHI